MHINSLTRLLQLTSPSLPVGGYAYSQGLESAIEMGWVSDESGFVEWMKDVISTGLCRTELPLLARLYEAASRQDANDLLQWSDFALACRESKERYQEDLWLASAYRKVLAAIAPESLDLAQDGKDYSFLTYIACACRQWDIAPDAMMSAFIWQVIENQSIVAMKLVPFGQTKGVVVSYELSEKIECWVDEAKKVADEDIGSAQPGWVIASILHETQYSRLYRS